MFILITAMVIGGIVLITDGIVLMLGILGIIGAMVMDSTTRFGVLHFMDIMLFMVAIMVAMRFIARTTIDIIDIITIIMETVILPTTLDDVVR